MKDLFVFHIIFKDGQKTGFMQNFRFPAQSRIIQLRFDYEGNFKDVVLYNSTWQEMIIQNPFE